MILTIFCVIGKIFFCFVLSVGSAALSEALLHKYLFHKKNRFGKFLSKLWGYDPETHLSHHKICYRQLEDVEENDHEYWIQRPSNVLIAGLFVYLCQWLILWLLGFGWKFYFFNAVLTAVLFTFWFKFEDHFHIAMHKQAYYMKHIYGTWQDPWFQYAKYLHSLHHKNPRCNFGFIFFPIGDLLLGSFRRHPEKNLIP